MPLVDQVDFVSDLVHAGGAALRLAGVRQQSDEDECSEVLAWAWRGVGLDVRLRRRSYPAPYAMARSDLELREHGQLLAVLEAKRFSDDYGDILRDVQKLRSLDATVRKFVVLYGGFDGIPDVRGWLLEVNAWLRPALAQGGDDGPLYSPDLALQAPAKPWHHTYPVDQPGPGRYQALFYSIAAQVDRPADRVA
jgi:hypothetical protein